MFKKFHIAMKEITPDRNERLTILGTLFAVPALTTTNALFKCEVEAFLAHAYPNPDFSLELDPIVVEALKELL